MSQKFHRGDLVHVAKDLGPSMSHFTADVDAIVLGSYNDLYSSEGSGRGYALWLKGVGKSSWYDEDQLTLLEHGREDLLQKWTAERTAADKLHGDLDWIFTHGDEVLKGAHSASVEALAACFGERNLWGSQGEGVTYYMNALHTLALALPFLRANDKEGWLRWCEERNGGDDGR